MVTAFDCEATLDR